MFGINKLKHRLIEETNDLKNDVYRSTRNNLDAFRKESSLLHQRMQLLEQEATAQVQFNRVAMMRIEQMERELEIANKRIVSLEKINQGVPYV